MAVNRIFDQHKGTAVLTYKGVAITPELNLSDPKQLFEVLSGVIERAYQKLRDAGIE